MEEIDKAQKLKESKRKSYLKNKEKENERTRNYYEANKEELLRKQVEYRAKNKERIAQRKKEYRQRNKEAIARQAKFYREENKETITEKSKLYYEQNKEVLNEKQRLMYDPLKRKHRYERNKSHILNRCRQYYSKNKENIKFKHLSYRLTNKHKSTIYLINKRYGIGAEEYEKMKLRQENRCAICSTHAEDTKRKILYVDHDHKTGYVRSLLCHDCNSGIGFLKDSEDLFMKAIEYIRKFKSTLDG